MKIILRIFALTLFSSALLAQQPAGSPPPSFGQVTGRVFCHDTGQPGRFAGVELLAEQPSKEPLLDPASLGKNPDLGSIMVKAMGAAMKGSNLSAMTALDGSFSLDKVPPGTYYVIPQLAGYLSPASSLSQKERAMVNDDALAIIRSSAQKVVVQANQSVNVSLELERGATLSGRITYDDGSPAPGVTPELLLLGKDGKWKVFGATTSGVVLPSMTDDRGAFRFFGLAAGKYAVKAALPTVQTQIGVGPRAISMHMDTADALVVYSGGALREKEIKPIELGDAEERDGVDVVFPLNGLRSLSGSVVARADSHPVNAGTVELDDPDSKAAMRTTMIGQDGSFKLNYVPDGSYLLKITSAADTAQKDGANTGNDGGNNLFSLMNRKELKSYGPAEMPLIVKGDVSGLEMRVPDKTPDASKGKQ